MRKMLLIALCCLAAVGADAQYSESRSGMVDVSLWASSGDGSGGYPWVDALRNALAVYVYGEGHHYHLPTGYYEDTSPVTISDSSVRITGDGKHQTVILYRQADGTPCWQVVDPGNTLFRIQISDLEIDGGKVATGGGLYVEDISDGLFANLWIKNFNADTMSYGIKTGGRDHTTFRNLYLNSNSRCMWISNNPNHATLDCDHFYIESCVFGPGDEENGYGIYIDANGVYNLSTGGSNSISQARYGIYWANTANFSCSKITLRNIRIESGGASGYGVFINPNDDVANFIVDNVATSGSGNGFYFRNVHNLVFINPWAGAAPGKTAFDIDAEGKPVVFIGGLWSNNEVWKMGPDDKLIMSTDDPGSNSIGFRVYGGLGYLNLDRAVAPAQVKLTYGPSVDVNLKEGNNFIVAVTNDRPMTLNAPVGAGSAESFVLIIKNSSGGIMGDITWDKAYIFDDGIAPNKPGDGKALVCRFEYISTAKWLCVAFGDNYSY